MKDLKNRLIYMWIQNIKIEKETKDFTVNLGTSQLTSELNRKT